MTDDTDSDTDNKVAWTVTFSPEERERLDKYHTERDILPEENEGEQKTFSSTIRTLVFTGLRVEEHGVDVERLAEQRSEPEDETQPVREGPSPDDWFEVTRRAPLTIRISLVGGAVVVSGVVLFLMFAVVEHWGYPIPKAVATAVFLFIFVGVSMIVFAPLLAFLWDIIEYLGTKLASTRAD